MKTGVTPWPSARESDFVKSRSYLIKELRTWLAGLRSAKAAGFTKRVYILAAIDAFVFAPHLYGQCSRHPAIFLFRSQPGADRKPLLVCSDLPVTKRKS